MRPEELFLANLPMIERVIGFVARRNRMEPLEAEEFASTARLKLIENDYGVLRLFEGKSQLSTYLTVVLQRVALDLRVQQWGKWRPSAEAKRLGDDAMLLEQLLHRDGLTFEEARLRLRTLRPELDAAQIELLWSKLPERSARPRFVESGEELLPLVASDRSSDELTSRRERETAAHRASEIMSRVIATLEPDDRLILKLRFGDSLKVSTIAPMIGEEQKHLYKRIDRILARLRGELLSAGLTPSEVGGILEGEADSLRLNLFASEEMRPPRPSDLSAGLESSGSPAK
jgi:RNA polymerase sigma factor (sigma-70 family)